MVWHLRPPWQHVPGQLLGCVHAGQHIFLRVPHVWAVLGPRQHASLVHRRRGAWLGRACSARHPGRGNQNACSGGAGEFGWSGRECALWFLCASKQLGRGAARSCVMLGPQSLHGGARRKRRRETPFLPSRLPPTPCSRRLSSHPKPWLRSATPRARPWVSGKSPWRPCTSS